jgi:hypothetical protein
MILGTCPGRWLLKNVIGEVRKIPPHPTPTPYTLIYGAASFAEFKRDTVTSIFTKVQCVSLQVRSLSLFPKLANTRHKVKRGATRCREEFPGTKHLEKKKKKKKKKNWGRCGAVRCI